MRTTYQCLSDAEREEISRGLEAAKSFAEIAAALDRPTSAVSREVDRSGGRQAYRACVASRRAMRHRSGRRSGKTKLARYPALRGYVHLHLQKKWSPEQIATELKKEYPRDMTMRISDEAIYQYLYVLPKGTLKRQLIRGLRQERKYRRKQRKGAPEENRGKIADMLSIEERPKEVADRIIPGHWEGDCILGKYQQSAMGTLVERMTRYVIMVPLKAKDAASVRRAFTKEIQTLPQELRKSLTYDQGKEMAEHQRFTLDTGMQVYFAHPGSPWERGTNENTNMLIRQYFPKGTDFRTITTRQIKAAQRELNGRPRKTLGWNKPDAALKELLH